MDGEVCGRKQPWPKSRYYPGMSGEMEENHETLLSG
jgi:hypothetical protein